jgi:hypothetical protein
MHFRLLRIALTAASVLTRAQLDGWMTNLGFKPAGTRRLVPAEVVRRLPPLAARGRTTGCEKTERSFAGSNGLKRKLA